MTRSSILVVALALAALGGARPTPALASHTSSTLQVFGILSGGTAVERTTYSLGRLRDLRIVGWWTAPGPHVQRLEIRAPDGSLYQRLTQKFTRGSHNSAAGWRGMPVTTVLPVGGTWITEYSLIGTWQIDLFLDDSRTPVASYSFELTP